MVNLDTVIARIMQRENLESYRQVSDLLGISPADFSNRKRRGTLTSVILEWAINQRVNLDWLFYGEGQSDGPVKVSDSSLVVDLLQRMKPADVADIQRECQRRVEFSMLIDEVESIKKKLGK